jgi:uncharacterized protein YjbI with pentapeptide repeats
MSLRPKRPPARRGSLPSWAFIVLLSLLIVSVLIWAGYTRGPGISGFGESVVRTETTHFTGKNKVGGVDLAVQTQNPRKVWDWIGLIGISAVIGAVGVYYTYRERKAQETAENQRAQDEALGAYLDQMSNLMIDKKLRHQPEGADQWRLAQARTIAVLLGLDKDRKRRALKLLYELGLIQKGNTPHINLKNAGLDKADLSEITLHDACLAGADLRMSDLRGADLKGTDLSGADLRGADLSKACLAGADTSLRGANLLPYKRDPTELSGHNINGAELGWINLRVANLGGADLSHADLNGVHLGNAYLKDAKLRGTNLIAADLRRTNLKGADLNDADLSGANLSGATGITTEELQNETRSLRGATMPDGKKHA